MKLPNLLQLLLPVAVLMSSCETSAPLASINRKVDLNRYTGKWFEIAKLPNRFQKGCECATANYTLRADGQIDVLNGCTKPNGETKNAKGIARTTNELHDKLEVSFFPFIWGKYWILDLDENYQTVMVGHPNRKYLWILSRKPNLPEPEYQRLITKAKRSGFDISHITRSRTACKD